jgi:hypothetical protein
MDNLGMKFKKITMHRLNLIWNLLKSQPSVAHQWVKKKTENFIFRDYVMTKLLVNSY